MPITVRRRPCVVPKQFTTHSRIPRMTLPRHRDWFGVVLVAFGLLALAVAAGFVIYVDLNRRGWKTVME